MQTIGIKRIGNSFVAVFPVKTLALLPIDELHGFNSLTYLTP